MYNNRRAKNNKLTKNVKDYIIPIIIGIFTLLIIFNIFSGEDSVKTEKKEITNSKINNGISINFKTPETKAYYKNNKKEKIELKDKSSIDFGNELNVESGIIGFKNKNKIEGILDSRGELKINKNNNLELISSNLFLKPKEKTQVDMKFITVTLDDDSVVSLTQNDAASSVYVLSGFANITTKAKKTLLIPKGKKITILSKDTHNENLDIKGKLSDIEKSYLNETWCSIINCSALLENKTLENSSGATLTTEKKSPIKLQKNKLIEIKSISDGQESIKNKIDITGKIFSKNISSITINNISANIDSELDIFTLKDFELKEEINDIIYKVFDNSGDLISRGVITIYYTGKIGEKNISKAQTINYPKNDKYIIELPGASPFTTTERKVTIKGRVPAGVVSKIMVNNFTLTKFKPNSTLWWYHANMLHGNMKEGTNEYKIKYFGDNGKILYTQVYFIIKK